MLEEIRHHAPASRRCSRTSPIIPAAEPTRPWNGIMRRPLDLVDYAVMERTRRAVVARAGFRWDDLGSAALEAQGGRTRTETSFADGSYFKTRPASSRSRRVDSSRGIGVKDLVIVHTGDVTLVCPRDRAQEVRSLVEQIKKEKDADALL
jgi:mannose-1-phosphate guanylyltransferase